MTNFDKLYQKMNRAESIYSQRRDKFYDLINDVLNVFNLNDDNIDEINVTKESVVVYYSWRAAGCDCNDSIWLSKSLFDSDEPVRSAIKYKMEEENKLKEKDRLIKLKEFNRLKDELGII